MVLDPAVGVPPNAVENLNLLGNALYGYGNALDNWMRGNSNVNRLEGFAGNDTLDGAAPLGGAAGADILDSAGRSARDGRPAKRPRQHPDAA